MRWALVALSVLVVPACGDDGDGASGPRERGDDDVGGHVVATVDGVGIPIAAIETMVRETGASPEDALDELVERELLAAEARRRGWGDTNRTRVAVERAMVQQFLAERVEGVVTPESISDEAIRGRYEAEIQRYVLPERRRSTHLLFTVDESEGEETWRAAEREAASVLAEARRGDAGAVLAAAAEEDASGGRRLEHLEPHPRHGALEESFAEALFATPAGSVHPATVRTRYGVHVIFVEEVLPEQRTSLEEAADEIRERLVVEGRAALVSEIIQEASEERAVDLSDAAMARAAALELDT